MVERTTRMPAIWRCWKLRRKDQCNSKIWFREFAQVKSQLGPAPKPKEPYTSNPTPEPEEPRTPKKYKQRPIDSFLTPTTPEKLNRLPQGNRSPRVQNHGVITPPHSKRREVKTLSEPITPTKKRKTEAPMVDTSSSNVFNLVGMIDESTNAEVKATFCLYKGLQIGTFLSPKAAHITSSLKRLKTSPETPEENR
nr:uncharacterized protein CTRU02_13565 [Colletotrichum truncatum]KAF6783329.1 hypothetical protein CTRU02_13565 [Colletotrichum truncatum]